MVSDAIGVGGIVLHRKDATHAASSGVLRRKFVRKHVLKMSESRLEGYHVS